jgi:succinyl-diaminopimelate desuccinylase
MPDPVVARLHEWLKAHEQELLDDYRKMLQIPSIEGDPALNAPFGQSNREALDLALELSEKAGMKTKDMEGFIGYADFGQGERLILSLGHLDVVPVGPGWKHEPFGAEIDEGYVYSRGAVDDKGPTMASFFAMRAIKECCPDIPARMRQVFGCNEESGFKCVEHYAETEEPPTFGVAPDSGWPLYNGEKGITNLNIELALNKGGDMELLGVCGGQRPNIVIDSCEATVHVRSEAQKHVKSKLADAWDKNVEASWDGDVLKLKGKGKAAHGATPFLGDSAATRIFRQLFEISPVDDETYYEELVLACQTSGAGIGINGEDEVSKDLTCNLGIVSAEDGVVKFLFNIRYPVTWEGTQVADKCRAHLKTLKSKWTLADVGRDSKSLYFPLEHPLVKAIVRIYEEETGEKKEPGVMGGGTYARAIPNTVSIGTGWDGDGKAHETDERLKIEHLYKMSRIYAHIFYELATMPA